MLVLSISNCPPALRGDLTKWLFEVSTGVYIGQVNARVREALWKRIKRSAPHGEATMVWNTNNEQGLDFRIHNSSWEPIDFDGVKLMMRPNLKRQKQQLSNNQQSNARRFLCARNRVKYAMKTKAADYVVIDIETTGLNPEKDEIIELGALRVQKGQVIEEYQALVQSSITVPASVEKLTGITSEMLQTEGKQADVALDEFYVFIGNDPLVSYNIPFDLSFINLLCKRFEKTPLANETQDVFKLAKRTLYTLGRYRLSDVAEHLGVKFDEQHRALSDCYIAFEAYERLQKMKVNENDGGENKKA